METIEGYIKMLDKKGDREGLKQALKARKEASQNKGKKFVKDKYNRMAAIESERPKGKDFVKSEYKKMAEGKERDSDYDFDRLENDNFFPNNFDSVKRMEKRFKSIIDNSSEKPSEESNKVGDKLREWIERRPQSDDSLKDEVLKAYDKAKYPDIMESKTDPRIKRAELSEESKVKSLSDYTSGKVEATDDKKEMDEDEIKEFIRKSRKRTGQ